MLRVKEICKEKGITLQDLSKRLGITYNTLHLIITGNPKKDTLEKIAAELNVSIIDLFERPEKDTINCPHCGGVIKVGKA
ncbi:MAG: helix-turn-helix transcriptional regulator [Dysgonamonadaceae bacterium]|jgi:transcriptional regulator with XRE-family HTH domain|nr:helix-turn-helix transcriptional regulator [Dysgonamonadaceae bacterium]